MVVEGRIQARLNTLLLNGWDAYVVHFALIRNMSTCAPSTTQTCTKWYLDQNNGHDIRNRRLFTHSVESQKLETLSHEGTSNRDMFPLCFLSKVIIPFRNLPSHIISVNPNPITSFITLHAQYMMLRHQLYTHPLVLSMSDRCDDGGDIQVPPILWGNGRSALHAVCVPR